MRSACAKISPESLFLMFWSPKRSREECMEAAIAVIPLTVLFCCALFCLVTSACRMIQSAEGLAIVPLARHRFQTKRGQFNTGEPPCERLHWQKGSENVLAEFRKSTKTDVAYSIRAFWSRLGEIA